MVDCNEKNKNNFKKKKCQNNGICNFIYTYTDFKYCEGDYFIFGKETKGLPEPLLAKNADTCIRIPMLPTLRSLNLSNSVAVIIYEALRCVGFENMQMTGQLHNIVE